MLVDLHMHSHFSFDAQPDSIPDIAAASIQRGLSAIVISDHKDYFWNKPPLPLDLDGIMAEIDTARELYGDKIEILKGIELGEPNADPAAMELLDAYPFDTVIGSLHAMPNDIDFYDMDYANLDQEQLIRDYLIEAQKMAQHGGFDVFAHLDYPLRVMKRDDNHPSFENFMEWVVPVLKAIIDRELSFEINAAGLFSWLGHVGPEDFVLEEYHRLGGTMISIGSDSHSAQSVGRGIESCIAHAKKHGFQQAIIYRKRKPDAISL